MTTHPLLQSMDSAFRLLDNYHSNSNNKNNEEDDTTSEMTMDSQELIQGGSGGCGAKTRTFKYQPPPSFTSMLDRSPMDSEEEDENEEGDDNFDEESMEQPLPPSFAKQFATIRELEPPPLPFSSAQGVRSQASVGGGDRVPTYHPLHPRLLRPQASIGGGDQIPNRFAFYTPKQVVSSTLLGPGAYDDDDEIGGYRDVDNKGCLSNSTGGSSNSSSPVSEEESQENTTAPSLTTTGKPAHALKRMTRWCKKRMAIVVSYSKQRKVLWWRTLDTTARTMAGSCRRRCHEMTIRARAAAATAAAAARRGNDDGSPPPVQPPDATSPPS
jgi:hypothetical protein